MTFNTFTDPITAAVQSWISQKCMNCHFPDPIWVENMAESLNVILLTAFTSCEGGEKSQAELSRLANQWPSLQTKSLALG